MFIGSGNDTHVPRTHPADSEDHSKNIHTLFSLRFDYTAKGAAHTNENILQAKHQDSKMIISVHYTNSFTLINPN